MPCHLDDPNRAALAVLPQWIIESLGYRIAQAADGREYVECPICGAYLSDWYRMGIDHANSPF